MQKTYEVVVDRMELVPGGPPFFTKGFRFTARDLEGMGFRYVNTLIVNALWQDLILEVPAQKPKSESIGLFRSALAFFRL